MTAQLIDGLALAKATRADVAARAAALTAQGRQPGLAVILVGDNPASQVYVRNKVKACADAGFHSVLEKYDASMTEAELLARVEALNNDPDIHGILVQLPLPAHIDDHKVIENISPLKDVDGFHVASAGALMVGEVGFKACTPYGCMKMLESIGMGNLKGKHAVVIGRSNIVGKPVSILLQQQNATVTMCHSRTKDLAGVCRSADILVAAAGNPKMVKGDWIQPGAAVMDVGVSEVDGKLIGDVDFEAAQGIARLITPSRRGIGPMPITMLLRNTLNAYLARKGIEPAS